MDIGKMTATLEVKTIGMWRLWLTPVELAKLVALGLLIALESTILWSLWR